MMFYSWSFFILGVLLLLAESLALLHGLQLCVQHGLFAVEIESDSKALVHIMRSPLLGSCSWRNYDILSDALMLLQTVDGSLSHVFREANTVKDFLACHASESCHSTYFMLNSLPLKL